MKIVALAGGVGGAKLAQGLSEVLPPDDLTIIVNTGDDFIFYGLYICPDLDTVTYTLAGMANPKTGWGVREDTFKTYKMLQENESPSWFQLGDKDLATHMERTRLYRAGKSLTEIALYFKEIWDLKHAVLPMCDQQVPTYINTIEKGMIPFQEYFVKYNFEPAIKEIVFKNTENAEPGQEVMTVLKNADAIVICPSNPFVSIDPILALPNVKKVVKEKYVLAVSPIIGGKAVKGPLAKMYQEMNITPSPVSIATHYSDFLDCIYLDNRDKCYGKEIQQSGIIFQATDIMMPDLKSRKRLASEIIDYINRTKK